MHRREPDRNSGAAGHRAGEPASIAVANDARRERTEMGLLRVLCIGIAGAIAADVLILIYFRLI